MSELLLGKGGMDMSARFWADCYSYEAPSFDMQIAGLEISPRDRAIVSHAANADRSAIVTREFTESAGMLDLQDYLIEVSASLESVAGSEAQGARSYLQDMRGRFSFLGTEEYTLACQGIALAWTDHLRAHPNAAINVIDMKKDTLGRPNDPHSYNQVPQDVIINIEDPDISKRVICEPNDWQENENSKLVAVDDWMISGDTAEELARRAYRHIRETGKTKLLDQFELHLLIGAANKLGERDFMENSILPISIPGVLRGFFRTPDARRHSWRGNGTFVSGAHSSVDYDFNVPLGIIGDLLSENSLSRRMPLITYIEPTYSTRR